MSGLTRSQRDCLLAIDDLTATNDGVCPSYDDLCDALGLRSKANVKCRIDALEERGMITRLHQRARSIAITPAGHAYIDALCEGYEFSVSPAVEWGAE